MGAIQAYHWAALFPEAVERIAVVCGAARCAPHNHVFIEGVKHALASIRAKTLLMPGDQDLYFQVEDNRREMRHLQHAELQPIPSAWGHRAGNPLNQPEDRAFIETRVRALLAA